MVGNLEGKEESKQQVSAGQVEHVDHCRFSGTDRMHKHHHGNKVEGHADDEDEGVNGRDKACCQEEDEQIDVDFGFVKHLHDGHAFVLQLKEVLDTEHKHMQ
ncbi:hypothetical protein FQN60_017798 [Etheostoma spectabile]|uniref:Uncharacterized protein n=1 Tax=Etheostoma spectabile TaxID=54343 RepID=A0A5J5DGE7_9PERO|nr:hypothetical protein FQN60_017798 [Etheostoma spectabile]